MNSTLYLKKTKTFECHFGIVNHMFCKWDGLTREQWQLWEQLAEKDLLFWPNGTNKSSPQKYIYLLT